MRSPFQSIIGTPENAVEDQVERNECNSYSEEVAEIAAISIAPKEPPFGLRNFRWHRNRNMRCR